MKVGVPKESATGERRVAVAPDVVPRLMKLGHSVHVERGAGEAAGFPDAAYEEHGAHLVDGATAWSCEAVVKIELPCALDTGDELDLLTEGALFISLVDPARNLERLERMAARNIDVVALDRVPRITRAQKMDVLSSMANMAGYRAVIEAAHHYGGFFTGQMTAAGKAPTARVLVIGAGVAGLAAIGAARGLGAEVRAFDVRPACREQVESMGASFLEVELELEEGDGGYAKTMSPEFIEAEMKLFRQQAEEVDIIITTALIPGRPAPLLITEDMVRAMRRGSVVVDLAAPTGGNCQLTEPGEVIVVDGVTVVGLIDLTSRMAPVASRFFGRNVTHLLDELGGREIDLEDEVFHQATVVLDGAVRWPIERFPKAAPPPTPQAAPPPPPPPPKPAKKGGHGASKGGGVSPGTVAVALGLFAVVGMVAPAEFLQHFTVFVLACFVGWQVIWNVTPALHTPLMSVTNAISGIILVGGMLAAGRQGGGIPAWLGATAVLLAAINIAGGFLVTQRMLQMFRK